VAGLVGPGISKSQSLQQVTMWFAAGIERRYTMSENNLESRNPNPPGRGGRPARFSRRSDHAEYSVGVDRRTFLDAQRFDRCDSGDHRPPLSPLRESEPVGWYATETGTFSGFECSEAAKGTCADGHRRILQGRTRPIEFAHYRPDAHYLRFYQRCTKLPAAQLSKATALKVHLYGRPECHRKGHGTERAALAGLIGKNQRPSIPLPRQPARES